MFQKPYHVKTQTAIKGSDRKKVRASLSSCFPDLTQAQLNEIVPAKEEMTVTKAQTHSGETTVIYTVNKVPVLFELDRRLYPTVYMLWKHPSIIQRFTTYPEVVKKLAGGADLMLPGLVVKGEVTPSTFKNVQKGDICAVNILGNMAAVAVGNTLMSGSDMFDSGMKGKGVRVIHMMGDELWSSGDKSRPPLIPDPLVTEAESNDDQSETPLTCGQSECDINSEQQTGTTESSNVNGASCVVENNSEHIESDIEQVQDVSQDIENLQLENEHATKDEESVEASACTHVPEEEEEMAQSVSMTTGDVDELLVTCFKCAIKCSVKKSDLPLLTSAFYKLHMQPYCPAGKTLDIKKSSYKKFSKFLKQMQTQGYIKVRELSVGVDSIVDVDRSHAELRNFTPLEIQEHEDKSLPAEGATGGPANYEPPEIAELFSITATLVPLVKQFGHGKGSALTGQQLRTVVSDYVKMNNLQSEEDKRLVLLDPLLADIVLAKGEGNTTHFLWNDLFSKILGKAQAAYSVTFSGQPAVVHKGKLDGIHITVAQRASNKKVTLVDNLETFGIDPGEFAHFIQKSLSVSCSVVPHAQKGKGLQALIQGNQMRYVADLLTDKYRIPRKYLSGLEKMSKQSGRKR